MRQVRVAGGAGSWFWDGEGHRWLDLHSQLGTQLLGHQHPAVVAAVRAQAERMCASGPSWGCEIRDEAARLILDTLPGSFTSILFTGGGADAVEHALRMARLVTGRPTVLAAHRSYPGPTDDSYHGGTNDSYPHVTNGSNPHAPDGSYHDADDGADDGTMGVTGNLRRWTASASGASGTSGASDGRTAWSGGRGVWSSGRTVWSGGRTVRFSGPYLYRSNFRAASSREECERALHHVRRLLDREGPRTVAAIVLEPVVGGNGVLVPPDGYLAGVRELCDEHGILLIADEATTGFGRCGAWTAGDLWGLRPDLLTFAEGVSSGYVPVGGVALTAPVARFFGERAYPGGITSAGHPLACASAVAALRVLREDGLVERAARLGGKLAGPLLAELAAGNRLVGEVRGVGLAWAIELVRDRDTREPLAPLAPYAAPGSLAPVMAEVLAACQDEGVWPLAVANRIHLLPPLVITEGELEEGIVAVGRALTRIAARLPS
ncbi:aminotransferase class III-fold pyridoxal phosphate-dependent enzyme [Nonomuraea sp. NN258]|uniref:aminotransferase class III-fold pyridoxal phosphate-dependent enzyme n=1 Tax=Nonomuraea antri TaxID=2730852 RepID=UPI00156A42F7|nr:aminotransferase class III-fold pyridoxal phosphate-dependent enzyme [Nonomuraea antri]NRQ39760.1 aminotransferase class III-fold pyridoxal phosphate-dependent enzyme [Nonomuraea antri]